MREQKKKPNYLKLALTPNDKLKPAQIKLKRKLDKRLRRKTPGAILGAMGYHGPENERKFVDVV